VDIGGAVTRKIGPLPAWGWGVAIGGAILAVRFLRGGGQDSAAPVLIPTGAPAVDPSQGFLEQLANAVGDLRLKVDELANRTTPTPPPTTPPSTTEPTPPVSAKPDPLAGISWPASWPSYARTTIAEAKGYAQAIIQNYSPGGAFYGKAETADRYRIPYIPTGILSASEQAALANQYGGSAGLRV